MSTPPRHLRVRRALLAGSLALASLLASCVAAPPPTTTPPATGEAVVRPITFPVSGTVSYIDSYGAPRSGGRTHAGQDLMGAKGTPLVAAVAGVVTRVRHDTSGLSGNLLTIKGDDGWTYIYIHLNNDSPGTDDGLNRFDQAFAIGVAVGVRVTAGQHVGFMGDSGNAEDAGSHLHFEIQGPDGVGINPYQSLRAASAPPHVPRSW
ncbi:MAG: M23 family metallopeptidase [Microthrixaceae bacterium]